MSAIEALLEFWSMWGTRLRWEEGFPDTWQITTCDNNSQPPSATRKVIPDILPRPEQTRGSAAAIATIEASDSY